MKYHLYVEENCRRVKEFLLKVYTKIKQQSLEIQSFNAE